MMTSSMIDQSFAGVIDECRNAPFSVELCGDNDARSIDRVRMACGLPSHEFLRTCICVHIHFWRGLSS
jgi:hypothetical protein